MSSLYLLHDTLLYPNVPGLKDLDMKMGEKVNFNSSNDFEKMKDKYESEKSNATSLNDFYASHTCFLYQRALECKIINLLTPDVITDTSDYMKQRVELLENALNNLSTS